MLKLLHANFYRLKKNKVFIGIIIITIIASFVILFNTYQGNEAEPQKGALKEDGINSQAYKNFQVEKDVKIASIYLLYWGDRAISNTDGNSRKYRSDDIGATTDDIDSDSGGDGSG